MMVYAGSRLLVAEPLAGVDSCNLCRRVLRVSSSSWMYLVNDIKV